MATTTETLSNFIDGELVASGGDTEPVLNPSTGEELAQAPRSTPQDVDRAVGAARAAFAGWRCWGSPMCWRNTAMRSRAWRR